MSPLLLLLSLGAHAGKAVDEYGTVQVKKLEVQLALDPAEPDYSGTSILTFEHSKPVQNVTLHAAEGLEITEAWFFRGDKRWPAKINDIGDEQRVIYVDRAVPLAGWALPRPKKAARGEPLFAKPSHLSLQLEFTNTVNEQAYGLYSFEHDGKPYLITQFEADDAREAFPCIDLPDAKVSFWLSLTVPTDLVALSNGPAIQTTDNGDGTKTVMFGKTRPVPTYAMAMAVGPYEAIPIPGLPERVPGQLWTVAGGTARGEAFAAEIAPLLAHLEGWFGTNYPYQKLDFAAVPEFAFGGMENPGLVILADRSLVPADERTPDARRWQQELIAHEIAHMWFGDLVTLKWWDDFWLNESFAEFAGNRTAREVTGDVGFDFRRVSTTQGSLRSDSRGTMRPVRTEIDPNRIFETTNNLAYPKGEALLTMVEAWIGKAAFQTGVQAYLKKHKDANATSSDLFAALSAASGKDVGAMLGPWLDRPGGPLITLEPAADGTVSYRQERYLAAGAEAETDLWWTTPVVVRWSDDAGVHRTVVLLDQPTGSFSLPADGELDWLFPQAEGIGYLAWTLPEPWLDRLIGASPKGLSVAERGALVGNLALLSGSGSLDGGTLLAVLERFASETHPEVIDKLLSAQSFAGMVVEDQPELEPAWAAYVRATRGPWLDRIGIEPKENEDPAIPELRARLLAQLLDPGEDPAIRAHLLPIGQAFLDDEARFDPALTPMALSMLAEEAEPALQDLLLDKANTTANPRFRSLYLSAFATVPGEAQRDRALAMALDPETPMRDLWPLTRAMPTDTDEEKDFELDWVIANHEALLSKLPPQGAGWLARTGSGCDADRWERAKGFFGAEERSSPAVDRAIVEGDERVALCRASLQAHGESVAAYLAAYQPDEAAAEAAAE